MPNGALALSLILATLVAGPVAAAGTGPVADKAAAPVATLAATTLPPAATEADRAGPPRPRPAAVVRAIAAPTARNAALRDWIAGFRGRALAQGIAPATFDRAVDGIAYDPAVIRQDRTQPEFTTSIWTYLDRAVSDRRIEEGRAAARRHSALLEDIEARYGVEPEIVVAIWGLETSYGAALGDTDVIAALATLAHDGRRGRFFEAQLVAALRILQTDPGLGGRMTGSWAGAMGHTQFIPTSYLAHTVDFDGDGRRDIWGDAPADALASTAAYLSGYGWTAGMPWGVEVALPDGFDYAKANRRTRMMPSDWARIGVTDPEGDAVPDHGPASLLLPAGSRGAAFLIFDNFDVLERYNTADAYMIGVGHLADRIAGGAPFRAAWPRGDRSLNETERREMQRELTARGFDTQGVDGRIGPLTIAAIRGFQRSRGMIPDGYASLSLLETLR